MENVKNDRERNLEKQEQKQTKLLPSVLSFRDTRFPLVLKMEIGLIPRTVAPPVKQ
jgi:hypothetical protein